jgi:hypothetical protein
MLEANIAAGNRGTGFHIEQSENVRGYSNNANFNDRDGIGLDNSKQVELVANMLANNNQSSLDGCGIRLGGQTAFCRLHYNNCQDTQNQPTQTKAVIEEPTAGQNRIQFNLARAKFQIDGQQSTVGENYFP